MTDIEHQDRFAKVPPLADAQGFRTMRVPDGHESDFLVRVKPVPDVAASVIVYHYHEAPVPTGAEGKTAPIDLYRVGVFEGTFSEDVHDGNLEEFRAQARKIAATGQTIEPNGLDAMVAKTILDVQHLARQKATGKPTEKPAE